jgi:hypothetical protein
MQGSTLTVRADETTQQTKSQFRAELQAVIKEALAESNPRPPYAGGVEFVDVTELARRLDLSPRTIPVLAQRGELPAGIMVGGVRRWVFGDVVNFLQSRQGLRQSKGRGGYARKKANPSPVETSGAAAG